MMSQRAQEVALVGRFYKGLGIFALPIGRDEFMMDTRPVMKHRTTYIGAIRLTV
jgi:hypothetical protein